MASHYEIQSIVIDKSGSMQGKELDVKNGLDETIQEIQKNNPDANIIISAFNTEVDTIFEGEAKDYKSENVPLIQPNGMTHLYEVVDSSIKKLMKIINNKEIKSLYPGGVTTSLTVVTDGHDTSCQSPNNMKESIKKFKAKRGILSFLGANQDAIISGNEYGIDQGHSLTFGMGNIQDAMRAASNNTQVNVKRSLTGDNYVGFSQVQRQQSAPLCESDIEDSQKDDDNDMLSIFPTGIQPLKLKRNQRLTGNVLKRSNAMEAFGRNSRKVDSTSIEPERPLKKTRSVSSKEKK